MRNRFQRHLLREVHPLDGLWDFTFLGEQNPEEVNPSAIQYKDLMAVPGCFDATPRYAGKRGLAAYRTRVLLQGGSRYRLIFHSVHHWCRVFVGGQPVGDHAGGFGRFRFDLPAVRTTNLTDIVVLVDNRFVPSRCPLHQEHFDWYQFGGISRPVELHRLGDLWIDSLRAVTEKINPPALKIAINYQIMAGPGKVPLEIYWDGKLALRENVDLVKPWGRLERMLEFPGAALWFPENPLLHYLEVRLAGDDWRERIGLRMVRTAGRKILINEQPVRLLGFNRHESHPQFGHAIPEQLIAADVQQLLDMGCNFVRGSHYPQDERFLELCDEVGICVWDEVIGWQHTAEHLTDEGFLAAQHLNLEEMVVMAQNHPSVILYGILNESHSHDPVTRRAYARLLGRLRELDPSRPVTFATNHVFEDVCLDLVDVISVNCYPGWYHSEIEDIPAFLDKVVEHLDTVGQGGKPLILSEIGAAAVPGWRDWNEDRWSEQYQARLLETVIRYLFIDHDRFTGLSIWQFCDTRTGGGIARLMTRARGFNNKGVLDEYRRPKMAYDVVRQLFRQLRT